MSRVIADGLSKKASRQYAELSGDTPANFTAMPQVGGNPIVESGSNSNGSWTKWADGTLTQFGSASMSVAFTTTQGDFFRNTADDLAITLPLAFFGTIADYTATAHVGGEGFQIDALEIIGNQQIEHESTSEVRLVFLTQTSVTKTLTFGFQAIGRWK